MKDQLAATCHVPSCGALMDESDMCQTQGGKDDSHEH